MSGSGWLMCHAISKDYPGYTYEETESKIKHALNDAPGAHSCEHIRKQGFSCHGYCGVNSPVIKLRKARFAALPHPYIANDGGIFELGITRDGEEKRTRLSNFTATITEEIRRDDGWNEPELELTLEGILNGGDNKTSTIKAADYKHMGWVNAKWGAGAIIEAGKGNQDSLRAAIQYLSENTDQRIIYVHTGWRKINGAWCYLHGKGAIGAQGSVSNIDVDLGQGLDDFGLPEPPDDPREAYEASLTLLDVADHQIMVPLVAATFLSVLAEPLGIDFVPWVYGATGTYKSSIMALCQAHHGAFTRTNLPGAWSSTANALEKRSFTLKDTLLTVDDFAPQSSSSGDYRQQSNADRFIRALGNRAGRQRLQADLQEARTFHPRGLVVSTAELLPVGQSILARIVPIEITQDQVDLAALSKAQELAAKGLFSSCMAAFVKRMAASMGSDLKNELRQKHDAFRLQLQSDGHARIPEALAWLAVGWELFKDFGSEVLSQDPVPHIDHMELLKNLSCRHATLVNGEDPAQLFVDTLADLFRAGKVWVKGIPSQPGQHDTCNNNKMPAYPMVHDEHATLIGWLSCDRSELLLNPTEGYVVVVDAVKRQGDYLGRKRTVFRALKNRGWIRSQKDRNTVQQRIEGKNTRVLALSFAAVIPDEDTLQLVHTESNQTAPPTTIVGRRTGWAGIRAEG